MLLTSLNVGMWMMVVVAVGLCSQTPNPKDTKKKEEIGHVGDVINHDYDLMKLAHHLVYKYSKHVYWL